MTEEISYIPEPPETFEAEPQKKSKKTLWIIIAIVAVLLLCCCLAVVIAIFAGLLSFDDLGLVMPLLPYLSLI